MRAFCNSSLGLTRASPPPLLQVVATYEEWVRLSQEADELREKRNAGANEMKGKLEPARRTELVAQGKAVKVRAALKEGGAATAGILK